MKRFIGSSPVVITIYYYTPTITVIITQPWPGTGSYTSSTGTRHTRCDVTQQWKRCCKRCCKRRFLWIRAALLATQLCVKYISAAVNQHATIEETMFPVCLPRGYTTRISHRWKYNRVEFRSWELQQIIEGVGRWQSKTTEKWHEGPGRCKEDFIECCSYSETVMNPLPW
jgi:hypothetical protein